ncbi:GATA zinc finger domain-containing protein 14-like [Teleopsis dalmanni]|uniref:GATA zinc finger domain-containing protein 14-like n=1 Tax=Teleopsis dalmanni TaxID=139649 RepID=UPI0018CE89E1|nr:GATA zinc finger domain-containing protein 14-like [Teleopsis dalmanni]
MPLGRSICFGFFNKMRKLFRYYSAKSRRSNSRRIRFTSSTIWRDIIRKGKIDLISINPFVNYLNEYKRISRKYLKGELKLTDNRVIASRLSEKQSVVLASNSNHEFILRQFAVENWNSMSYRERKLFINLAQQKQNWLQSFGNTIRVTASAPNISLKSSDASNETFGITKLSIHSHGNDETKLPPSQLNLPLSRLSVINPKLKNNAKNGSIQKKTSKKLYRSVSRPIKTKRKNSKRQTEVGEQNEPIPVCNVDIKTLLSQLELICLSNINDSSLNNQLNSRPSQVSNEHAENNNELASNLYETASVSNIASNCMNSQHIKHNRTTPLRINSNHKKAKPRNKWKYNLKPTRQFAVSTQNFEKDDFDNDISHNESDTSTLDFGKENALNFPLDNDYTEGINDTKKRKRRSAKNKFNSGISRRQCNMSTPSSGTENKKTYVSNSQYRKLMKYYSSAVIKSKNIRRIKNSAQKYRKNNSDSDTSDNTSSIIAMNNGAENENFISNSQYGINRSSSIANKSRVHQNNINSDTTANQSSTSSKAALTLQGRRNAKKCAACLDVTKFKTYK